MAIQLKHSKTVAKADGVDNTVVQPSDWNATHTLTAAAGKVLGTVVGSTTVSELPISVDSGGKVGIGTAGPNALLDINSSTIPDMRLSISGTAQANFYANSTAVVMLTVPSIPLLFGTNNVERMRVTATGEVGLGTSSPASGKGITLNSPNNYFGLEFQTSAIPIARIMQESTGFLYIDSNINGGAGGTVFRTGAIERMRIDAAGAVTIGGSPVVTTSGTAAQGDVLYHNGTAWVRLAAGTSGQFLKTNGAGANPEWAAPGGGVTVLATLTTTSGTPQSTPTLNLTGYKFLRVNWTGVSCSNGNQTLTLNGANITPQLGNLSTDTVTGSAEWDLTSGRVNNVFGEVVGNPSQSITTATTVLTFAFTAGSFDAGTIRVYGIS